MFPCLAGLQGIPCTSKQKLSWTKGTPMRYILRAHISMHNESVKPVFQFKVKACCSWHHFSFLEVQQRDAIKRLQECLENSIYIDTLQIDSPCKLCPSSGTVTLLCLLLHPSMPGSPTMQQSSAIYLAGLHGRRTRTIPHVLLVSPRQKGGSSNLEAA